MIDFTNLIINFFFQYFIVIFMIQIIIMINKFYYLFYYQNMHSNFYLNLIQITALKFLPANFNLKNYFYFIIIILKPH